MSGPCVPIGTNVPQRPAEHREGWSTYSYPMPAHDRDAVRVQIALIGRPESVADKQDRLVMRAVVLILISVAVLFSFGVIK